LFFARISAIDLTKLVGGNGVAKINGLDKFSYVELINLQKRVEEAIGKKRAEDAQATKEQLRAMAEKAGFDIKELFGKRGSPRGTGVVKYRNPKDSSQTWTGRGRKPNWLVDAVKKGAKLESFAI
jgi:DNA-binding protein H-NS